MCKGVNKNKVKIKKMKYFYELLLIIKQFNQYEY